MPKSKVGLVEIVKALAARMEEAPEVFKVDLEIAAPASGAVITKAERALGAALPRDLVALYTGECASMSFAWSLRAGQEGRIRAEDGFAPFGQLELHAPGALARWHRTDFAVVFGDGTGDGVALDLGADAKAPFVTFDHDESSGGAPRYARVPAVISALAKTFFADEDLVTPTLARFLAGKGDLVKPPRAVAPKAPKAIAAGKAKPAVPEVVELGKHKWPVNALAAIDERRVVTGSYHERNLVIRDAEKRTPLGKLVGAGKVMALLPDRSGRLVSTGRGQLERFELATGKGEVLNRRDPYTLQAQLLPDGRMLSLTTATLELTSLKSEPKVERSIDIEGSRFWRLDDQRVIVGQARAQENLRLALVSVATGKIGPWAEWPIPALAGAVFEGVLLLALEDGSLAAANEKTLAPACAIAKGVKGCGGADVLLPDRRTWLVSRTEQGRGVLDVFDLEARAKRSTYAIPVDAKAPPVVVMGICATTDGARVVIGDTCGRVLSIATTAIVR